MRLPCRWSMLILCLGAAAVQCATPLIPHYDHVVVVIMSAHSYTDIHTSLSAPYINDTLTGNGASFTSSYAVADIAQPNYWALFSGSTQGNEVVATCPNAFTDSNLGRQLIDAGSSFAQYSEDLGNIGNMTCGAGLYTRSHNPTPDFTDLPNTVNHDYTDFVGALASATLPTVSFVVPNLCHDMHGSGASCSSTDLIALGDQWLQANIPQYLTSSSGRNGLLIVTWDQGGGSAGFAATPIPTIFVGPHVKAGYVSTTPINHYNVLRTLEDMYGLTPLGSASAAAPIADVWDLIFENGFE